MPATSTLDVLQVSSPPSQLLNINTEPPSASEVAEAVRSLKTGKTPGLDLLTAKMLQADLPTAVDVLTQLIEKIWIAEEFPDKWNNGLLITVPKKGDLTAITGEV